MTSVQISRGRKIAATGGLIVSAGILGAETFRIENWLGLTFAGLLAVASVGLTRTSVVAQVLSRGAAWVVALPSLIYLVSRTLTWHLPDPGMAALAVSSSVALVAAHPLLHTAAARAEFGPKAFRKLFLAGSTALVTSGLYAGGIALEVLRHELVPAILFAVLSASFLASSLGVLRMRSWGILLGGLTSLVLLGAALVTGGGPGVAFALAAAPALLLHVLPILVARTTGAGQDPSASFRVADDAPPAQRYRIAEMAEIDDAIEAPPAARPLRQTAVS